MRLYAVHKGTYFCVAHVKKNVFRTPPWLTRINVTQISRNLHASQVGPALSGRMASIGSDPSIGSASRAGIEDTPSVSLLSESLMTRSAPQPLKSPGATDLLTHVAFYKSVENILSHVISVNMPITNNVHNCQLRYSTSSYLCVSQLDGSVMTVNSQHSH